MELTSAGETDGFLGSFDSEGNLEWIRQLRGAAEDIGWGVEVASDGDLIFLASYFAQGSLDDGLGGQEVLGGAKGEKKLLLARYSPAGVLQWTRTGGPLGDHIIDDVVDMPRLSLADDDSVFVVFSRPDGEAVLSGAGDADVVVPAPEDGRKGIMARFEPDGSTQWGRALSGLNAYFGLSVAALPDGSAVYVVSETSGNAVAGLSEANEIALSCGANYDCAVLARYVDGRVHPYQGTTGPARGGRSRRLLGHA